MRLSTIYLFSVACLTCLITAACRPALAQPVNFNQFTVESFPLTNGFPMAAWLTTETTARLDDENPFASAANASVNVFYGPDNVLGKRITGQLSPGNGVDVADDDVVGFVLGFQPGDTNPFGGGFDADYVLIDWKGVTQTFNFADVPGGDFFHDGTLGGVMPAGLAVSRVIGVPTADELWQHIDDEDGIDGGVTELARGLTLGDVGYDRDPLRAPYEFDFNYTSSRVTVIVDGVVQLDVTGSFPDGRFGLYTLSQGPTPIYSNFEISDAAVLPDSFPTATVDRDTGELTINNPGGTPSDFSSYSITSSAESLDPDAWTSVTGNYDTGGAGSVDSDAWGIDVMSETELAESEVGGSDGATLSAGQEVSLGNVWTASRFEDLVLTFDVPGGISVPVVPEFVGNSGQPFSRSDLNTDGQVNDADWLLFFPNVLSDLTGMSAIQAALLGDLDGDLDNDVVDFSLFKEDFVAANGSGSFAALVGAVPEPGSLLLALAAFGALLLRRRFACLMMLLFVGVGTSSALAQPLDFTQFTLEPYPNINFPEAGWTTTSTTATVIDRDANGAGDNTSPSVLYSPTNLRGKRIRGFLEPGTDDDVVGLVFGFQPGDASFGDDSADADYLLLDWKGIDQNFDFGDIVGGTPFNALTPGGPMPAGLALSRVTGLANMDEKWQHLDLEENMLGGVEELVRATSLGFTPYDRFSDPLPSYEFDIIWQEKQIFVLVDGELEIFQAGDFADGRFGVYTCCQSDGPVFRNFEVLEPDSLDLSTIIPRAVANRETGDIVLSNGTDDPVQFDFYQIESDSGSLLSAWQGLADSESGPDSAPGVSWVKAGGSTGSSLAELYLQGADGSTDGLTLNNGESITLSGAYNGQINGEDLTFIYRTLGNLLAPVFVEYEGIPPDPTGLPGDYNEDGTVNAADYTAWRANIGADSLPNRDPGAAGPVGAADYDFWKANYGATAPLSAAAAVPEPSGLLLLVAATLLVAARRS